MRRKIIKQGSGGCTIFLPIQWIRDNNLKPGDDINIEDINNQLLISAHDISTKRSTTIEVERLDAKQIEIILNNAYRSGFDSITVTCKPGQKAEIAKIIEKKLIGFEITESNETQIVLLCVAAGQKENYVFLVKRLLTILSETFNELSSFIEAPQDSHLTTLREYREKTDRIVNFYRRSIIKKKGNTTDTFYLWTLCGYILQAQHVTVKIAEDTISDPKNAITILRTIRHHYDTICERYKKSHLIELQEGNKAVYDYLYGEIYETMRSSDGKSTLFLHHASELLRLILFIASTMIGSLLIKEN